MVEAVPVDLEAAAFLPGKGFPGSLVTDHLDGDDHAGLAHFRDMGVILERFGQVPQLPAQGMVGVDDIVLLEDIERGQGGAAAQRVAGIAVGMQKRGQVLVFVIEGTVDVIRGEGDGKGQIAAGQAL